jgi:hypothetical protein
MKESIFQALDICDWKVSGEGRAAELLAITLASKIKKLKIKKTV